MCGWSIYLLGDPRQSVPTRRLEMKMTETRPPKDCRDPTQSPLRDFSSASGEQFHRPSFRSQWSGSNRLVIGIPRLLSSDPTQSVQRRFSVPDAELTIIVGRSSVENHMSRHSPSSEAGPDASGRQLRAIVKWFHPRGRAAGRRAGLCRSDRHPPARRGCHRAFPQQWRMSPSTIALKCSTT